jgi:flagella basal body P-ring formation protein FlgA
VLAAHAWAQQAEMAPDLRSEVSRLAEEAATQRDAQQAGLRVKVEVGQLDPRLHLAPCQRIQPYLPPACRPGAAPASA